MPVLSVRGDEQRGTFGARSAMLGARAPYVADITAAPRRRYRYVATAAEFNSRSVRHLFAMGGGAGGDFLQALTGFPVADSVK